MKPDTLSALSQEDLIERMTLMDVILWVENEYPEGMDLSPELDEMRTLVKRIKVQLFTPAS